MAEILVDMWLYGELARYGGEANQAGQFCKSKSQLA